MMAVRWTSRALSDLVRLHELLAPVSPTAAAGVIRSLATAARRLAEFPRIGEQLDELAPREVRRLIVGRYELRSTIEGAEILVLRLWHTREQR